MDILYRSTDWSRESRPRSGRWPPSVIRWGNILLCVLYVFMYYELCVGNCKKNLERNILCSECLYVSSIWIAYVSQNLSNVINLMEICDSENIIRMVMGPLPEYLSVHMLASCTLPYCMYIAFGRLFQVQGFGLNRYLSNNKWFSLWYERILSVFSECERSSEFWYVFTYFWNLIWIPPWMYIWNWLYLCALDISSLSSELTPSQIFPQILLSSLSALQILFWVHWAEVVIPLPLSLSPRLHPCCSLCFRVT